MSGDSKGFIKFSYENFDSEWWQEATGDHVKAILNLSHYVAHINKDYPCRYGVVHLKKGQFVTSLSSLANLWHCTLSRARSYLNFFTRFGLVQKQVVAHNDERHDKLYTILTVIDLGNPGAHLSEQVTDHLGAQEVESKGKKEVKEENIPPKKSPQGDFSTEGSSVLPENPDNPIRPANPDKRDKPEMTDPPNGTLKKRRRERLAQLTSVWDKHIADNDIWLADGVHKMACSIFTNYLPQYQSDFFANPANIEDLMKTRYPPLCEMNASLMDDFLELHMVWFAVKGGKMCSSGPDDLREMAHDLRLLAADLSPGQVSLLFYSMLTHHERIGKPKWNNEVSRIDINVALGKFLEWCAQNK